MMPPVNDPSPQHIDDWRRFAQAYLAEQFQADAPASLGGAAIFEASPLEGEGPTIVFDFVASRGAAIDERFYVVVGRTEPNYYPAFGLSHEEAFCLHLGTRFMLVLGVARRPVAHGDATRRAADRHDFDPEREARAVVNRVSPDAVIEDLQMAAAFDVEGRTYAVLRATVDGRATYIFAGDAPPGFEERTALPPHVAFRLHLGRVLRLESQPKD